VKKDIALPPSLVLNAKMPPVAAAKLEQAVSVRRRTYHDKMPSFLIVEF
jgi:hypothetical protein